MTSLAAAGRRHDRRRCLRRLQGRWDARAPSAVRSGACRRLRAGSARQVPPVPSVCVCLRGPRTMESRASRDAGKRAGSLGSGSRRRVRNRFSAAIVMPVSREPTSIAISYRANSYFFGSLSWSRRSRNISRSSAISNRVACFIQHKCWGSAARGEARRPFPTAASSTDYQSRSGAGNEPGVSTPGHVDENTPKAPEGRRRDQDVHGTLACRGGRAGSIRVMRSALG